MIVSSTATVAIELKGTTNEPRSVTYSEATRPGWNTSTADSLPNAVLEIRSASNVYVPA